MSGWRSTHPFFSMSYVEISLTRCVGLERADSGGRVIDFQSGDGGNSRLGTIAGHDDDLGLGNLDEFALVVHAGVQLDGAQDAIGGGHDFSGAFDHEFEGATEAFAAILEQADGVGVAIDRASPKAIFLGDVFGTAPVKEIVFDGSTIIVTTDFAVSGVVGVD